MLIYILVFIVSYLFSYLKKYGRILSLFILVLFIGLRFDVGTDYINYKGIYETVKYYSFNESGVELGYYYLNKWIDSLLGQFWGVTIVQAIVVLGLFYYSFSKYFFYSFALLIFLLNIDCGFVMTINTMRQAMAIAIVFVSIEYIKEKKLLIYSILIFIAFLFHLSAIFVWPLYFMSKIKIRGNIILAIYLVVLILSIAGVWNELNLYVLSLTHYAGYVTSSFMTEVGTTSGIVIWFWRIMALLVLISYKRISEKYPEFILYLNIFVIFVISREILISNFLLYRMRLYLQWTEFLVYPLFFSLYQVHLRRLLECLFIVMMVLVFLKQLFTPEANLLYNSIL